MNAPHGFRRASGMALRQSLLIGGISVSVMAAGGLGILLSPSGKDTQYQRYLERAAKLAAAGDKSGAVESYRMAVEFAPSEEDARTVGERIQALTGGSATGPAVAAKPVGPAAPANVPPAAQPGPIPGATPPAAGPGVESPPGGGPKPVATGTGEAPPPGAAAAPAAPPVAAPPPPEFPDRMEEGEALAKEGKWTSALEAFERARAVATSDEERAKAEARATDARAAIQKAAPAPAPAAPVDTSAAAGAQPRNFETWLFEGDDRLAAGEEAEAMASYRKALENAPGEAERQAALERIDRLRARTASAAAGAQPAGPGEAPPPEPISPQEDNSSALRRLEFERRFSDAEGRRLAGEWSAALAGYQDALAWAPRDEDQRRVRDRIGDVEARAADEQRNFQESARAVAERLSDYQRALAGGDASRDVGRLQDALIIYLQARSVAQTPEETAAVEQRIAAVRIDLSYQQALSAARAAAGRGDWDEVYLAARWAVLVHDAPEARDLLERARSERALVRRQAAFLRWMADGDAARGDGRVADALYAYQRALDAAVTPEQRGRAKTSLDETAAMEQARQAYESALQQARAACAAGDWRSVDRWAREALRFADGPEARSLLAQAQAGIVADLRRRKYQRWMQEGEQFFGAGDWPNAMAAFDRAAGYAGDAGEESAARGRSRDAQAQLGLAQVVAQLLADARMDLARGDYHRAWFESNRVLQMGENAEARMLLAEIQAARALAARTAAFLSLMSQGDYARSASNWPAAARAYREAVDQAPTANDRASALNLLNEVNRTIALENEYLGALALARDAEARGDWNAVLAAASRAYQIRPTDEAAHMIETARAQAQDAARRADFEAALGRARGFIAAGQFHPALEWFEKAIALAPTPAEAAPVRAELAAAQRAHDIQHDLSAARTALAAGNLDEAQARCDQLRALGDVQDATGIQAQIDGARAMQGQRATYQTYINQGMAAFNAKDWAGALAAFAQAAATAPTAADRASVAEWKQKTAAAAAQERVAQEEARRRAAEEAVRQQQEEAARLAREAAAAAARQREQAIAAELTQARAALAQGDLAAARAAVDRARAIENSAAVQQLDAQLVRAAQVIAQRNQAAIKAALDEARAAIARGDFAAARAASVRVRSLGAADEAVALEKAIKAAEEQAAAQRAAQEAAARQRAAEEAAAGQRAQAQQKALADARAALAAHDLAAARAAYERARVLGDSADLRAVAGEIAAAEQAAAQQAGQRAAAEQAARQRAQAQQKALADAHAAVAAGDLAAARAALDRARALGDSADLRTVAGEIAAAEQAAAQQAAQRTAAEQAARQRAQDQQKALADARAALAASDLAAARAAYERARVLGDSADLRAVSGEIAAAEQAAAQRAAQDAASRQRAQQVQQLLAAARTALAQGDFAAARAAVQRAHALEDSDAVRQVAAAIKAAEEQAAAQRAAEEAARQRAAEEAAARQRAAEEAAARQRAQEQQQAVSDARAALAAGDLAAARAAYDRARALGESAEVHAVAKEIKAAERAAADKAAEGRRRAQALQQLLAQARAALNAGDFATARAAVQRARTIDDSDAVHQLEAEIAAAEQQAQQAQQAAAQRAAQEAAARQRAAEEAAAKQRAAEEAARQRAAQEAAARQRAAEEAAAKQRAAEEAAAKQRAAQEAAARQNAQGPAVPAGYQLVGKNAQGFDEYRAPKDGAVMILVPGASGAPAFLIDKYEVSNGQYMLFCRANNIRPQLKAVVGGRPDYFRMATHPVVFVSHEDAAAYAQWAGKSLPSAQEWQRAAKGNDGRQFPWGNAFQPAAANLAESGTGMPAAVTAYPGGASPVGCLNLVGNVGEWLAEGTVAGGGFETPAAQAAQGPAGGGGANQSTGFRCVVRLQ